MRAKGSARRRRPRAGAIQQARKELERECTLRRSKKPFSCRFIELFAGVGGFRLALEALGGECVFASEVHPTAVSLYEKNFGEKPSGDIRDVLPSDIPPFDVLTGGFPCQPFSGISKQEGFKEKKRGNLFWQIIRILRACQPKGLLLENVVGLLGCDKGRAMQTVLQSLTRVGYRVGFQVLDSQALLPQLRKRVYIVGIREDLSRSWQHMRFPSAPSLALPLGLALDLPRRVPASCVLSKERWEKVRFSKFYESNKADCLADITRPGAPLNRRYGSGRMYTQCVPRRRGLPRLLTPRETARMQGFPEWFTLQSTRDGSWYKVAGNAVSIPMVGLVASSLLCALSQTDLSGQTPSGGSIPQTVELSLPCQTPSLLNETHMDPVELPLPHGTPADLSVEPPSRSETETDHSSACTCCAGSKRIWPGLATALQLVVEATARRHRPKLLRRFVHVGEGQLERVGTILQTIQ